MPRKIVERRAPSPKTRHCDFDPGSACPAYLTIRLSPSAIRGYDWLVLYRCEPCDQEHFARHDSAPAVAVFGCAEPEQAYQEDDGDADDQPWGV